jgi:hypothetical protein
VRNNPIGENRIPFNKHDVKISIDNQSEYKIDAIVENSSFQWIRVNSNYLTPRVRLKVRINSSAPIFHIEYKSHIFNFQQSSKNSYAELYYSLFEKNEVLIKSKNVTIAKIGISFKTHKKERVLIDYSCSRNSIEIDGLENEHLSIGCKTRRVGSYGKEKPMLEIQWLSPELEISNNATVPHYAAFLNQRPVSIQVTNRYTKKTKTITIKAKIPKRLHRLFTAYGYGAHALHTKRESEEGEKLVKKTDLAPALFFYINYKISDTTSIRGFNAGIFKESSFNNAGIYLGSDFGHSLDNKLYFSTLLGVQYLFFKFDKDSPEISEPIFPQGVEFMYRHAFDIPNYIISGGLFLSTSESIDYENIWIRWGKNYFWEVNLITWGKDQFEARTWGFSVGFPFKGFL